MIYGFLDPWETLFIDLNIPKILLKIYEKYGEMEILFYEYENVGKPMFIDLGKGGHQKMMKIR